MNMKKITIEICCDGSGKALEAQAAGAGRIELCADLPVGGITPPHEVIVRTVRALEIPVNVLVRPRAGDFRYTPAEIRTLLEDIRFCADAGADGVVVGALDGAGDVDVPTCRALIGLARNLGLSVTFHRAIDEAADLFRALDAVLSLRPDRILTSGGAPSAFEGRAAIARMVRRAHGHAISIMPGAGVTADNVRRILEETGAAEIHGSRLEIIEAARFA